MMKCWYKEGEDISDVPEEELLEVARETLARLGCTNYGYLSTPEGEEYAKKLKTIARKVRNGEKLSSQVPESILTWLTGIHSHKEQLNKILLERFKFKKGKNNN